MVFLYITGLLVGMAAGSWAFGDSGWVLTMIRKMLEGGGG